MAAPTRPRSWWDPLPSVQIVSWVAWFRTAPVLMVALTLPTPILHMTLLQLSIFPAISFLLETMGERDYGLNVRDMYQDLSLVLVVANLWQWAAKGFCVYLTLLQRRPIGLLAMFSSFFFFFFVCLSFCYFSNPFITRPQLSDCREKQRIPVLRIQSCPLRISVSQPSCPSHSLECAIMSLPLL
jgi:hypothetical protein